MSKEKENAAAENAENKEVATVQTENVDFKALENAEKSTSLNMKYLELAEGEEVRGYAMGVIPQEIGGKLKDCVGIYTKDGAKVSAAFMLVQTLRNKPEGTPISILFEGVKDLGGGKKLGRYAVNELKLAK